MNTIHLSEAAHPLLCEYLANKGYGLSPIQATKAVYPEISYHADIYMCKLGGLPDSSVFHIADLSELRFFYPENIKYNAVCMGDYFIHNLRHTSERLLNEANRMAKKSIDVKQGYTKCSMAVVNNSCAITSDEGIYHAVSSYFKDNRELKPLNLLLIRPEHVALPGFAYGFIGGTCGRVGNEMIFNGNLKAHPDFDRIETFIQRCELNLKYFEQYPLTDIGSIIEETCGEIL